MKKRIKLAPARFRSSAPAWEMRGRLRLLREWPPRSAGAAGGIGHERSNWNQTSALVPLGLLVASELPVADLETREASAFPERVNTKLLHPENGIANNPIPPYFPPVILPITTTTI